MTEKTFAGKVVDIWRAYNELRGLKAALREELITRAEYERHWTEGGQRLVSLCSALAASLKRKAGRE